MDTLSEYLLCDSVAFKISLPFVKSSNESAAGEDEVSRDIVIVVSREL